MNDMSHVIVPKSDQWNFDDFQAGEITFKITGVKIKAGQDQPVSMSLEGTDKVYRPCKSMARVIVNAWGADSKQYVGRSFTLYGDPTVRWGGMAVGGIRISHMTDIDSPLTMALTATKGSRKPYTVKPLVADKPKAAPAQNPPIAPSGDMSASGAALITADEAIALETRCKENNIKTPAVFKHFGIERFDQMNASQLVQAHEMIDSTLAKRMDTL